MKLLAYKSVREIARAAVKLAAEAMVWIELKILSIRSLKTGISLMERCCACPYKWINLSVI